MAVSNWKVKTQIPVPLQMTNRTIRTFFKDLDSTKLFQSLNVIFLKSLKYTHHPHVLGSSRENNLTTMRSVGHFGLGELPSGLSITGAVLHYSVY